MRDKLSPPGWFAGIWFVRQHFWFLDITVGGLHLHTLCKLALAALLPALMVPGLVYSGAPLTAVDALVMLQVRVGWRHTPCHHLKQTVHQTGFTSFRQSRISMQNWSGWY
jgi:hypothetical protein